MMRLQKYIAECGVTSRRKAEELILSGRVKVNGLTIDTLGTKVANRDKVSVDNKIIRPTKEKIYILMNKPKGVVTTVADEAGRKTVIDIVDIKKRIYPIGRLDRDTEGLLILTNDGDLAYRLMHPKFEIDKKYIAKVGDISADKLDKLSKGAKIDEKGPVFAKLRIIKKERKCSFVEVIIREGRNRQIRKMFESVGERVYELKRIAVGQIHIGNLKPGEYRSLTFKEVEYLINV